MHKWRNLPLLLLGLLGCGVDSTLLVIETQGRPAAAQSLRLAVTLNSKRVVLDPAFTENLDNFGLRLPPMASGPLLIEADGLDASSCVAAQGRTDTILTGSPRVRLRLEMSLLAVPSCAKP